jgi:hypothetical protein
VKEMEMVVAFVNTRFRNSCVLRSNV